MLRSGSVLIVLCLATVLTGCVMPEQLNEIQKDLSDVQRQISLIDSEARRVIEPGIFEVSVGGKQPGFGGLANATSTGVVSGRFEVVGQVLVLEP